MLNSNRSENEVRIKDGFYQNLPGIKEIMMVSLLKKEFSEICCLQLIILKNEIQERIKDCWTLKSASKTDQHIMC